MTPAEAKTWVTSALAKDHVVPLDIADGKGGWRRSVALPGTLAALEPGRLPPPGTKLRILSPFDPALRDRKRAQRLFGFDYRIEIFTPEAKRRYGYYVFPVLGGDQMIGRIDMKVNRATDSLDILGYWPEPRHELSKGRVARLRTEIERYARLTNMSAITIVSNNNTDCLRAGGI